jgi:RNA polymerase sigma factor (sigma-70 family)
VTNEDWLVEQFEGHRGQLLSVAGRLLGSPADADDAVQEAWIRLSRVDVSTVDNLGGWLTTVVSRLAIDRLRARATAGEATTIDDAASELPAASQHLDPETEAVLSDSVGAALLVVLDTLAPAERLAFVLHDTFAVPFAEVAEILGRSVPATKQLAHRARTKVQRSDRTVTGANIDRRRELVNAFLAAARNADVTALVQLLDPSVDLHADDRSVRTGAPPAVSNPDAVAAVFTGRAQGAVPVAIDGGVGLGWIIDGRPKVVWDFVIEDDRVSHINMLADPETLSRIVLAPL